MQTGREFAEEHRVRTNHYSVILTAPQYVELAYYLAKQDDPEAKGLWEMLRGIKGTRSLPAITKALEKADSL